MKANKKNEVRPESYQVDNAMTTLVKGFAMNDLNADLIGIANIERFKNAPPRMCPQGLMPSARSVVVMAITHLDGSVEIGGKLHPQEIGPYWIQYGMNSRLDEMSYKMALKLESFGYNAVPIASSNIWRFDGYKELTEQFAPDVSHMHCAVAAGLAEFGYNGLAITPEYGARQRYVTIITNAELTPSPLLEPGSVCDNCMLCRKHCMSQALSKEINGWNIVKIEDKEYKYANKNLWRCSWGEHFGLDLDLELPDKVDKQVILDHLHKYGRRGGEMGSCLRHCVSKESRFFDKEYTNAPRRKKHALPNPESSPHRGLFEKLRAKAADYEMDFVVSISAEKVAELFNEKNKLPDAQTLLTTGFIVDNNNIPAGKVNHCQHKNDNGLEYFNQAYCGYVSVYDMGRELQRWGYQSIILDEEISSEILKKAGVKVSANRKIIAYTLASNAVLPETSISLSESKVYEKQTPEQSLAAVMRKYGMTVSGVSSVKRFNLLADQIADAYEGHEIIDASDKAMIHVEVEPEITAYTSKFLRPSDYLPQVKSVIVLGLKIPQGAVDSCARYSCEALGSYAFSIYESSRLATMAAMALSKALTEQGYESKICFDLAGTASKVNNSRGIQDDIFANRFAAVAAGLGRLTQCGFPINPEEGSLTRYIAVVTDAELNESPMCDSDLKQCQNCDLCVKKCKTRAHQEELSFSLEGIENRFRRIDTNRCEWAKRYSFIPEEGNTFMGWNFKVEIPEKVTIENLADAMKKTPAIVKHHACNFESCVMSCPIVRNQQE